MSTTTELTLSQKIRLFLEAHGGMKITDYRIAPEGLSYKDSNGKFTLKSQLVYIKLSDGMIYTRGFKKDADGQPLSEEAAHKSALYRHLADTGLFACHRCGGAGGFRHWPGFYCFECNGDKVDHSIDIAKELDRALAGQDFAGDYLANVKAEKEAQKLEIARQHAERMAADARDVAQWKSDNAGLVERAKACLAYLGLASKGEWANQLQLFIGQAENAKTYYGLPCEDATVQTARLCTKVEQKQLETERQAQVSKHVGERGERSEFTARVVFVKDFENEFGTSHLTVLNDDEGNVLKYWNTINLPDPSEFDPKGKRPAEKGERVTFSAKVAQHDFYQGVPQTQIQRVTKARLA